MWGLKHLRQCLAHGKCSRSASCYHTDPGLNSSSGPGYLVSPPIGSLFHTPSLSGRAFTLLSTSVGVRTASSNVTGGRLVVRNLLGRMHSIPTYNFPFLALRLPLQLTCGPCCNGRAKSWPLVFASTVWRAGAKGGATDQGLLLCSVFTLLFLPVSPAFQSTSILTSP